MPNKQIDFSDEVQLKGYISLLTQSKPFRWEGYDTCVKHAAQMHVHFNGDIPTDILHETRPNEPKEIKAYREKIFEPITKSKAKKIVNVLQRINNSKNYSIKFPDEVSKLLKNNDSDNSLENYLVKNYPIYGNLFHWVFDVVLKQMLVDPNAIICFKPYEATEDNEFPEPFGFIYPSRMVIDPCPDNHYTILLDEKSDIKVGEQTKAEGLIFNIYTLNEIIELKQIGNKEDNKFEKTILLTHNFDEIPVINLGGEYIQNSEPIIYESFVSGILPYWNKALRLDSDIDANYIQHLYLERVELQVECDNNNCGKNGAPPGQTCSNERGKYNQCQRCKGSGFISGRSPYGVTSVKKDNISGEQFEFPGVTYIDKPTAIVEISEKKLDSLIDDGFSAINMDILREVGVNQSGVSKTIDRTDLDSFLILISNNIFDNIIYYSIHFSNKLRYGAISALDVDAQMPVINKPLHFDVMTAAQIAQELSTSQNLPTQVKDSISLEYIDKKYPNDEFTREYNKAIIMLDPLRGKTSDEILTGTTSGWIIKEDAILSQNISKFLLMAYDQDANFFEKKHNEKLTILYGFVSKQLAATKLPTFVPSSAINKYVAI